MSFTKISLEHTGRFNHLILDYIKSEPKLNRFYSLQHTLANYKQQIDSRSQFPVNRELLTDSLLSQYQSIGGAKGSVLDNIESLRNTNTFTITTGHQLNIFTGPLYFVYKILHTIKLAEELRIAYPENDFVPIYWMNSEDHDIEEVGQFNLFGKKYVWEAEQTGATGRMNPESLADFCSQLEDVFSNSQQAFDTVSMFRDAYTKHGNLTAATRYFSNELFKDYGLVIIDSDDSELKRSFSDYFKKDIIKNEPYDLVRKTSKDLEAAGYNAQVNPRQINCFYLIDGIRNRIVATETGFKVFQTDIRFSEAELLTELENHPERFSPNVVLRPLFQEFILPNLTYVGGAGELSYWLQYKVYFNEMGISFPMLSLRNHFLLIDGGTSKKMEDLKVLPEDLFHSVDDLIKSYVLGESGTDVAVNDEIKLLEQLYTQLKQKAGDIDPSISASIEAEESRTTKVIQQWESRFSRSVKKNNEVSVNRINKIHKKLFPDGYLQERHDNLLEFHSKVGKNLLDEVYSATNPFTTEFTALRLD
jgi:bacillithiol biosynthesis cysteine-adding enzyme BshC